MDSTIRVLGIDAVKEETGGNLQLYVIQVCLEEKQYYIFRRYSEIKELYYIQLKQDAQYFSTSSLNEGLDKDILTIQETLDQIEFSKLKNFLKPTFYDISMSKSSACLKRIEQVNVQRSATLSNYRDEGVTLDILSLYIDNGLVNPQFINPDRMSISDDILLVKTTPRTLARSLSDPLNKKLLHSNSSLHQRFDTTDVFDFLSLTFLSVKRSKLSKQFVIHVAIGRSIHARNHHTIVRTTSQVKQFYEAIVFTIENGLPHIRPSRLLSFDKFKANGCQEMNQTFQVFIINIVFGLSCL